MSTVYGETIGIRKSILGRLEELYEATVPFGQVITTELTQKMIDITADLNREIVVYINRRGQVICVAVGDVYTVVLPEVDGQKLLIIPKDLQVAAVFVNNKADVGHCLGKIF